METTYYPRTIDRHLEEWKNDATRKPLLLRGARQVGKSSAVRHLGRTFRYYLEVNFERDKDAALMFGGNLQPREIASRLSALYDVPVIPGETLLFLDEIQVCPEAIHSLWFFYEDYRELHVIAAGSLLEFTLKDMKSFGVGRVRSIFISPMSFDEFLMAAGHGAWIETKRGASPDRPLFEALHNKLVESFRSYLMVGGMPESVRVWVEKEDYVECQKVQDDILITYEADFPKYRKRIDPSLLRNVLHAVAGQAGRKFVCSKVQGGFRTEQVRAALDLLEDAGLIHKVIHTAANGLPLGAEANDKFIKYLFLDSGLLLRMLDMDSMAGEITRDILVGSASDLVNKGSLTEMVAGLELLKYCSPMRRHSLYYWQNLVRGTQSEVDYVISKDMRVIPIEVKSGTGGSMKSLYRFFDEKRVDYGIRSSLEPFGRVTVSRPVSVDIYPLYALSNLVP